MKNENEVDSKLIFWIWIENLDYKFNYKLIFLCVVIIENEKMVLNTIILVFEKVVNWEWECSRIRNCIHESFMDIVC